MPPTSRPNSGELGQVETGRNAYYGAGAFGQAHAVRELGSGRGRVDHLIGDVVAGGGGLRAGAVLRVQFVGNLHGNRGVVERSGQSNFRVAGSLDDFLQAGAIDRHVEGVPAADHELGRIFSRAQKLHGKTGQACSGRGIRRGLVAFVEGDDDLVGNHLRDHLVKRGIRVGVGKWREVDIHRLHFLHAQRSEGPGDEVSRRGHGQYYCNDGNGEEGTPEWGASIKAIRHRHDLQD